MTLDIVYALRDDTDAIASIQKATLETDEDGLEPDPALFGSADWWSAIDRATWPSAKLLAVSRRSLGKHERLAQVRAHYP